MRAFSFLAYRSQFVITNYRIETGRGCRKLVWRMVCIAFDH